jgi:hypothetical protein
MPELICKIPQPARTTAANNTAMIKIFFIAGDK